MLTGGAGTGWLDVALLMIVAALLSIGLVHLVANRLSSRTTSEASRVSINAMSERLAKLEQRVEAMPQHSDMTRLSERVGNLERAVEVSGERLAGVTSSVGRIERKVDRLVEHLLEKEKS
jgi:phage shock protein A